MTPASAVDGVRGVAWSVGTATTQGQVSALVDDVRLLAVLGGLVVAAALVAGAVGGVHRWYARSRVPDGLSVLAGISVLALGLNTQAALGEAMTGGDGGVDPTVVAFNVGAFLTATVVALLAGRAGDRLGRSAFEDAPDARDIVRAVGRQITVTLPETVGDMADHDPVAPETKARLAGASLGFPRRLTVEELRARLVERIETDYGVGHVDVDLAPDGTVEYLAVGSRAAGVGPTLPPGRAAVAVRADPAVDASPGDVVQVWHDGERVLTGELRGVAGDVATLAVDEADAGAVDTARRYRLVTLPATVRVDREFAALFRAAEETLAAVAVAPDSPLVGRSVDSLAAAVVAVRATDGAVETLPDGERTVAAGETVYVVGRPDAVRRLTATDGVAAAPAPSDD